MSLSFTASKVCDLDAVRHHQILQFKNDGKTKPKFFNRLSCAIAHLLC